MGSLVYELINIERKNWMLTFMTYLVKLLFHTYYNQEKVKSMALISSKIIFKHYFNSSEDNVTIRVAWMFLWRMKMRLKSIGLHGARALNPRHTSCDF